MFALARLLETLMYPLLVVLMIALLTPNHMKPKICGFNLRNFVDECIAAHPPVYIEVYSAIYPVVYVAMATYAAVYSSDNSFNWFSQSGVLYFHRKYLIRLNGVQKLSFVYDWALVLLALKGCGDSFMSAYHWFTEAWSISTLHKVCAVTVAIKLVLGILWTFYCVIQCRKIEPKTIVAADGLEKEKKTEKETNNDKILGNILFLVVFTIQTIISRG